MKRRHPAFSSFFPPDLFFPSFFNHFFAFLSVLTLKRHGVMKGHTHLVLRKYPPNPNNRLSNAGRRQCAAAVPGVRPGLRARCRRPRRLLVVPWLWLCLTGRVLGLGQQRRGGSEKEEERGERRCAVSVLPLSHNTPARQSPPDTHK